MRERVAFCPLQHLNAERSATIDAEEEILLVSHCGRRFAGSGARMSGRRAVNRDKVAACISCHKTGR